MAKNQCSSTLEGRHQTILMDRVVSGDMVLVEEDGLHGVALIDTDPRGFVVIDIAGRWYLPVESGSTIAIGDALYCDATGGTLDNDPAHGIFFGYALEAIITAETGDVICVLVVQDHVPQEGELQPEMFEGGAAVAVLLAAGLGDTGTFEHDDGGSPLTILAANGSGDGDRAALVMVICHEAIGGAPAATAEVGETGDTDKFFDDTALSGMLAGEVLCTGGVLLEECAVLATYTAGTLGAGEFTVIVLALPAAS